MTSRAAILTFCFLILSVPVFATTFVVPSDEELIAKTEAVIVGVVEGSWVDELGATGIETVYEIRVSRPLKGSLTAGSLVTVRSPGGFLPGIGGVHVAASPHFDHGERVLLFLGRGERDWRVTDLALGKFRFVTSREGRRLLVRDMEDVYGWDRSGKEHREPLRSEEGFLRFVAERVGRIRDIGAGRDYFVSPADVTLPETQTEPPSSLPVESLAAPFPAPTYTDWYGSQPTRRQATSVTFYKRSDQNISGAADGGVSTIQNGLAAWTNAPGTITLTYGGQQATASKDFDGVDIVEFNDPQERVGGSWGGSGTIAITYTSFGSTHQFAGATWLTITSADVVFQNGFPGTHAAFGAAMTHELGHAIGFRHSDQHYAGRGSCDPNVEECTSAAIMNSSVSANYGFTLQPWDINAVSSVYAGSGGGTAPAAPGSLVATATSTTTVAVSWGAVSGATSYEVERSTNINAGYTRIATVTGTSYTDGGRSPNTTYVYRVRAVNSSGSSGYSNIDHATTIIFTDDPLTPRVTVIKAVHLTELRSAVSAMRVAAGLGPVNWTDGAPRGVPVKAIHITELRNALSPALSALQKSASYPSGAIARGTIIRAAHFQELRNLVK